TLIWKGLVLAWSLSEFFNRRRFAMKIEPLHPDGACGLRPIAGASMTLNAILFLVGIYLSLKVIDKIIVQDLPLLSDIGNPVMLGAYAVLAPLVFFLPLAAAHRAMLERRNSFLRPLTRACEASILSIEAPKSDGGGAEHIRSIAALEALRGQLRKRIPVWPFDFRSLQAFFGTIVVPLVPVLLPILTELIVRWASGDGGG
ncbi:MAG: hypothetical protein JSV91_12515, partial [Phycisphaerales bacterium]